MMKKLALLLAVVFIGVSAFGQAATTVKKETKKVAPKTEQVKTTAKTQSAATEKNVSTTTKTAVDTTKTHLKKDGTVDKRFKDNKGTAKTTGPVKKDGTPDMRYKENKAATSTVKK